MQPDRSQKNKSRMMFGALSRFPDEIITFVRHKMSCLRGLVETSYSVNG